MLSKEVALECSRALGPKKNRWFRKCNLIPFFSLQNNDETFGADAETILSTDTKSDLADLIKSTMLDYGTSSDENSDEENSNADFCDDDDSEEDTFEKEFLAHKRNYYINKLKYPEMTE